MVFLKEVVDPTLSKSQGRLTIVPNSDLGIRFVEVHDWKFTDTHFKQKLLENLTNEIHMRYSRQSLLQHTERTCSDYFREIQRMEGKYLQIHSFDVIIGTLTLLPKTNLGVEAGILIFFEFTNMGYGRAVWSHAIEFARSLGFRSFHAGTRIENFRMRKLMEEANMELDNQKNFPRGSLASLQFVYFKLEL